MKRICFILFFAFIFSFSVSAREIDLENKIISIPNISGYGLQGFTIVDNQLVAIFITGDDSKSIIKVWNLDNGKEIYTKDFSSLGHANDVTYNDLDKKIMVVHGGGSNIVHVFNTDYDYLYDIDFGLPIRSLTYIPSVNTYAARLVSTGFYFESDYSLKSKIPFLSTMIFASDVARQGWSYYNHYIYYTTWSWIRYGGDGSNGIYVYDLSGNEVDYYHINNQIGELEDIAFYHDQMVLGFNSYQDTVDFYMEKVPEIVIEEVEMQEEVIEKKPFPIGIVFILLGIVLLLGILLYTKRRF